MPDPTFRSVPPSAWTNSDLGASVWDQVGLVPDEDQMAMLDAIFAETAVDRPAAFEVATIAPRQNIKTSTLEIAALIDLFVLHIPEHVWTAHLFPTARKSFEHMISWISRAPDLKRQCRWPPRTANGDESIELKSGESISFHARSKGGGRGFVGVHRVTLDEALFLGSTEVGALLPTLATVAGAQVRYASSAGFASSAVLRGIRDRGRAGQDPRLAYFEWAAERRACATARCSHVYGLSDGCALDDRELWAQANPALGRRIPVDMLEDFRRAMPPEEFMREFLGWWEDPEGEGQLIPTARWDLLTEPVDALPTAPSFAVDVSRDRTFASIACVWTRADGLRQVEVEYDRGTAWVVPRLKEVLDRYGCPHVLLADPGPAGALVETMRQTGVSYVVVNGRDLAAACGAFYDAVMDPRSTIRHRSDPALNLAVRVVRTRASSDAWVWSRKESDGDVSPLIAATLALYGQAVRLSRPGSGLMVLN